MWLLAAAELGAVLRMPKKNGNSGLDRLRASTGNAAVEVAGWTRGNHF